MVRNKSIEGAANAAEAASGSSRPVPLTRRVLLAGTAAALVSRVAGAQSAGLVVVRTPPKVSELEFDPRRPPASMPALTPPEAAVCHYEFGVESGVDYSYEPFDGVSMRLRIDAVTLVTRLEVEVWTPRNARRKLLEHEQGHRRICEYYYANAEAVARAAAEPVLGQRFSGRGATEDEARKAAVARAVGEIERAYMSRTSDRCAAAQQRFDEITQHSTADVEVDEALAQAVAADPEAGVEI
jgi:hypothetical protein